MSGPPATVPPICKPVVIETDGVFGELETGAIINAGGTSNSSFTVDGVPVQLQSAGGGAAVTGFEYVQGLPALTWAINHGGGTTRATVTIYDTTQKQILPDEVQIIDLNNVLVTFNLPQAGIALILLF